VKGLSPVEAARQSIGQGMAAQEFGAKFFGQGATMSGVIEAPAEMPPGATEEMARAWARKHSGKSKSHLPGVLTGGATWKTTGVTNEQAQFLETRQFTAAEIAGQMFLIDPSELGIGVTGTSLTYANLEQRATRRVQVTYLPWIVRIENALSALLARPRYVKVNVNGLLRGDTKTRYETYQIGIANQIIDPAEAREFEDLPPRDMPAPTPEEGGNAAAF
jgi:HK97 family phage portal protein